MKLKGIFSKQIKGKDRKRKERTLKTMENTRIQDNVYLRDTLKAKLLWAEEQRLKGLKVIEQTKIQVERLNGVILFIRDLLNPKKEKE